VISKRNRFHGLGSLNRTYKKGYGAREGALSIKTDPNRKQDYRLAVVVSKKVSKSAVVRNRIRRRLYEAVRNIKQDDPNPWHFDIIVTCFDDDVADQPAGQLRASVEKLLKKAKITTADQPKT
jgi:ribonuclease P protein component